MERRGREGLGGEKRESGLGGERKQRHLLCKGQLPCSECLNVWHGYNGTINV